MLSSFSSTSSNPAVPATPMAPTSSTSADSSTAPSTTPRLPPSYSRDTCTDNYHTSKWVINLSKPPSQWNSYHYFKKDPNLPSPQIPPIEAYITVVEQASSNLPAQEADELKSDVNRLLKQAQSPCTNH